MNKERLEKLRDLLLKDFNPPKVYMFKFIVPNDNKSIARTLSLFDDSAKVQTRESKGGKYIAITAEELMLDVNSIIEKYNLAFDIEGLIAL